MIRVVVADDHPVFRSGVVYSLSETTDITVVGEATDGREAAEMVLNLKPDVVLLDITMPMGGGIGALARIRQFEAPPPVAMLTASEADEDLMRAIKLGAVGYILKGIGAEALAALVRDLAEGRSHISPEMAGRVLTALHRDGDRHKSRPADGLSDSEDGILKLVARGKSNREVGEALNLPERTVKQHVSSILGKLHVRNRVEAAVLARLQLVD